MSDPSLARSSALVVLVSCLAGVAAAACDVSPTGSRGPDLIVTFLFGAAVAWFGAAAPWWMITVAGVAAAVGAGRSVWIIPAVVAIGLGVAMRWSDRNQPWLASAGAGCIVVTLLNLDVDTFFGASAIVAAMVALAIVISGILWRERRARLIAVGLLIGVFVVGLASVAALAIVTLQARDDLEHGYDLLNDGLDQIRDGETAAAAQTLHEAGDLLLAASNRVDVLWTRPARLVPVVAQHRAALTDIVGSAAESVSTAADALDAIDLDRLQVVNGRVDVAQLSALAAPLNDLDDAVAQINSVLAQIDSPWLVQIVRDRIAEGRTELDRARVRTVATARAAMVGPALLGGESQRTYLVVFTSQGHARAESGVITNWAEIQIADGQISQTGFGRTADLVGTDSRTSEKAWADVTESPDWPTVAARIATMYSRVRRNVEGVLLIDPAGLAALLGVTGPITVEGLDQPLDATRLLQFLNVDQYGLATATRRAVVEAAAAATVQQFLSAALPAATEFGRDLGPAATEGHIVGWTRRPDEEALFLAVGMSGRFPGSDGRDGLAVVSNSVNGSEVDTFLTRSITYQATFDQATGDLAATLTVELENTAPHGVSRTRLIVYSPLVADGMQSDGTATKFVAGTDLGWNTASTVVSLVPGERRTVVVSLRGTVDAQPYSLVWRPQSVTNPDAVAIDVTSKAGDALLTYHGELPRTSIIDADGVRALR
jgi:Protein of unknown function (DUF4012)